MMTIRHMIHLSAALALTAILSGCGTSSSSPSTATISGTVFAGPVDGAKVKIRNTHGTYSTSVRTAFDGSFTATIPSSLLAGDLTLVATGGSYVDEATGADTTLGTLTAHVAANTLSSGGQVTIDPASTIIQRLVEAGKTRTEAETLFRAQFGYLPDPATKPAFALISTPSTTPQRLAGIRAAAFSRLCSDLGISPGKQTDLLAAIASDLADGTFDGGSTVDGKRLPPDIGNRFTKALIDFQQSTRNGSKLKADQIGTPPFHTVVFTDSYKVEFIEGSAPAATGKTSFKIRLTDRTTNQPVTGKSITLKPFMYMSTKSHATPADPVVESSTPGTYDCTVYYVMSTAMNGVSMGVWKIDVVIGVSPAETATFFPDVGMRMGTTPLVKLLGINDKINGMAGPEKRTWFIFDDGITRQGTGPTYTVKLFTATKATMTSFPAVYVGTVLKNDSNTDWNVNDMIVEVSSDKTNWAPLADASGSGHWSATGITLDGGKLYVRLTVNGEQKTTDGQALAADGSNGYQTFTVSQGMTGGGMGGGMTP